MHLAIFKHQDDLMTDPYRLLNTADVSQSLTSSWNFDLRITNFDIKMQYCDPPNLDVESYQIY